MGKKNYFIEGLPLKNRLKIYLVSYLIVALFLNTVLTSIFPILQYPYYQIVSIVIFILAIIISIGSIGAEGIMIGVLVLLVVSNWWDIGFVYDYSELRRKLMIWTLIASALVLSFGKISFTNVVSIIRRTFGQRR